MPRLPRQRRRPYPQLELGPTSGPPTLATPPARDALPASARRTLRSLLTRLLVAHARGAVPHRDARAGGDADERREDRPAAPGAQGGAPCPPVLDIPSCTRP